MSLDALAAVWSTARSTFTPLLLGAALGCAVQTAPVSVPPGGRALEGDGHLEWRPCWFDYESGDSQVGVECAAFYVPERWDATDARRIRIPVVVIRTGSEAGDATLIPGGGGPGQSVGLESRTAPLTLSNLEGIAVRSGRDLVIVDQRGAGVAHPVLLCHEMREATLRWLDSDPSVEEEAELWASAARRCRRRLVESGIDPAAYDSTAAARDLEALRRALGFTHWNLFGSSYAGQLALIYARAFPDSVRSLVLDSPGVPEMDEADAPAWFQSVLEGLFDRCASDGRCRNDFPDPTGTLDRLLLRFEKEPPRLAVSHPQTLEPVTVLVTPGRLLDVIMVAMYDTDAAHQIPLMLTAADRGSYDWLTSFVRDYVWQLMDPSFANGMMEVTACREWHPYSDLARAEQEASRHPWRRVFIGIERVAAAVCRAWDAGTAGEEIAQPVAFDGPALLLAGRLDPVIPMADVERAAESLASSTLIDFPGTGHGAEAKWWSCIDDLIERFLLAPDAALNADLIERCREEADGMDFLTLSPPESPLGR